jgi:ferredoxin
MGYFVEIAVNPNKCVGLQACGACVKVCPVSIFARQDDMPVIVAKNEDECILCDMCVNECAPDAITINKTY